MRKSIIFLLLTLLLSCKSKDSSQVSLTSDAYSLTDLVNKRLILFETTDKLNPILDTVIENVNNCIKYKNKPLGFIVTSYRDSINRMMVAIDNIANLYRFDYSICSGLFYYKGYQFACIGKELTVFLKDLNQKVNVIYVKPSVLKKTYDKEGEFYCSSWNYIYNGGKFLCTSFDNCGNYWVNKDFMTAEKE